MQRSAALTCKAVSLKAEHTKAKLSHFLASVVAGAFWNLPVPDLAAFLRDCLLKRPFCQACYPKGLRIQQGRIVLVARNTVHSLVSNRIPQ